jgi:integrase
MVARTGVKTGFPTGAKMTKTKTKDGPENPKQHLTKKRVARLLKTPGRYRDDDVRGLLLVVVERKAKPREGDKENNPSTTASWQLRFQLNGKEKWMGLGSVSEFSVEEARDRARAARQKLADGIDPLQARRDEKAERALTAAKTITFEQCAWQYFDLHSQKWGSKKWRAQFQNTLRQYVLPKLGALPVASVNTTLVLQVLQPHWLTKSPTMGRVRARIESVLDWAKASGYRDGDNPAAWKTIGKVLPPTDKIAKVEHHAALAYAALPAFLVELRKHVGIAARALEFAILTCARTGEVLGATWDEIDFDQKVWTVPASRIKAKKEHRVPLADATVKLLKSLPVEEGNPHIFIGSQPGAGLSHGAMQVLMSRIRRDATPHGCRSTFRDWVAERTNFPDHIAELALAHSVGSAVEKAYKRTDLFDRRRKLMDAWAEYCTTKPVKAGKVIPLKAGATS